MSSLFEVSQSQYTPFNTSQGTSQLMPADPCQFKCRQCGQCCRDLVQEDKGITRGLTLLPHEAQQFDLEHNKPAIGRGKRPHEKNFQIIAYQIAPDICPKLQNNQCTIYETRPHTCRQYPFSLDPSLEGPLLGVDLNCPSASKLVEECDSFDFQSKDSAEKLLELKKLVALNPRRYWYYDLRTEKWVRYNKIK